MKNLTTDEALDIILAGGVGVLPTDTLYGLVAKASDPKAVERLYALKNREKKPGTLIAANTEQLAELGLPKNVLDKVAPLWPNPLSIVMPVEGLVYLHQGLGDIPVRVVLDEATKDLLLKTGPLMTSSANTPGDPSSTTIKMAEDYFGDTVDFYVDGGDLSARQPSTIIGFKNGEITVFREGAISKERLLELQKSHKVQG